MPESIPSAEIKTMLDGQWNAGNVAKPNLIDVNDNTATGNQARFDLNRGDYVFIMADQPVLDEEPIGTWVYGHRRTRIICEVHTKTDRQRLYDLMAEIRRICHAQMHALTNYQRVQFQTFNEYTDMQLNVWAGRIVIELLNSAVLLETT